MTSFLDTLQLNDSKRVRYWSDGSIQSVYWSNPIPSLAIEQLPNLESILVEVNYLESTFIKGTAQGIYSIPDDELYGDYRRMLIELGQHPTLKSVYIFFTEDEICSDVSFDSIEAGEVALYRLNGVTDSPVKYYAIDDIH